MQAGAGSDKEMEMSEIIRLDKYLADMGCGTRSQVKQMIRKGQVEINGEKIKKPLTACMRTVSGPSVGDACPERLSGGQRNLE